MTPILVTADAVLTADVSTPRAEAVLLDGPQILAVGSRAALRAASAGTHPTLVDLPGATVIPGLIESHVHPVTTGLAARFADCRPAACSTIADIVDALRVQPPGRGGWVRGWGYDDTLLAEQRHPTRDDLDRAQPERPVFLSHSSGHFAVANSAALAAAGVDESTVQNTQDFPRDAEGRLTGLLWELDAIKRVSSVIPPPSADDLRSAMLDALLSARRRGVVAVHDMAVGGAGGTVEVDVYRSLAADRELPVRVTGFLRGHLALDTVASGERPFDGPAARDTMFRLAGAKFWADGSIQGLSAALAEPYLCDHDHRGALIHPQAELDDMVARVHAAGGQVAVHANGDAAVRSATAALAAAEAAAPRDARHRIEHCQVSGVDDLTAIVAAGLGVSFFVNHVYYWGDRHRDRFLGPERAARLDPLAGAADAGLRFGLHSDCPVTPLDPLHTMAIATNRITSGGSELGPGQRISAARALRAMTLDSAYLVHEEELTGSLTAGKRADLTVLDGPLEHLADPGRSHPAAAGVMIGGRPSPELS